MINKMITVIVNIYNEQQYLKQCVNSILAQTFTNLEIILVDDGSTDQSPEICKEYSAEFSQIQCILKNNEGLVRARKTGLEKATGDYVAFVDGDDWLEPEYYERLYCELITSEADIVVGGHKENLCGVETIRYNMVAQGTYHKEKLETEVYPIMIYTGQFSQFGIYSYVWNKLFKKDIFKLCQMQVDDRIFIGEDACSVYPALLRADSVRVIEYAGYHYRQRANSMVKMTYNYDLEYQRLKILALYLKEQFTNSVYKTILLPQLNYFLLSQVAVRTNGFSEKEKEERNLFPFSELPQNCSVVLYGAGTFGQHTYRRMKASKFCEILSWIDAETEAYQMLGVDVKPVSTVMPLEADYVVIARIEKSDADQAEDILCHLGVPRDKIIRLLITTQQTKDSLEKLQLCICDEGSIKL